MTAYSKDYLARLLGAVEQFEAAFEDWLRTQVEGDHMSSRGLLPTVWSREDASPAEARNLELKVAEAAGAASRAVSVTGAYYVVAGMGPIDPVANWALMSSPRALFAPSDIRTTAATMKGRLRAMIADSETDSTSGLPAFSPAQLHTVVWSAAANHWTAHEYRVAVREAAEALSLHWKEKIGRNDVVDTVFWQQTLAHGAPSPGAPKLLWPGDGSDKTVRSMREGLNHLATGLNLTIRNVATHTRAELTEQEGLERLAAYSYLARLLDHCDLLRAEAVAEDRAP